MNTATASKPTASPETLTSYEVRIHHRDGSTSRNPYADLATARKHAAIWISGGHKVELLRIDTTPVAP